jgi:hypothetical protein
MSMKYISTSAICASFALIAASYAYAQNPTAPAADASAAQNPAVKSPDATGPAPLKAGQNSFTMAQAKHRIEKAGYTDVSNLTKSDGGLWQGQAMKDGKPVSVSLDFKGNVAAQ